MLCDGSHKGIRSVSDFWITHMLVGRRRGDKVLQFTIGLHRKKTTFPLTVTAVSCARLTVGESAHRESSRQRQEVPQSGDRTLLRSCFIVTYCVVCLSNIQRAHAQYGSAVRWSMPFIPGCQSFFFSYGGRCSRDPVVIKVNDGSYKCVCEGQGALTCKSQTVHHSTVHGERRQ